MGCPFFAGPRTLEVIVALTERGSKLLIRGRTLTVQQQTGATHPLQLQNLSEVHFFGPVGLSGPARNRLLRESIELVFFTGDGRFLGRMSPLSSPFAGRRLKQYDLIKDPTRRVKLCQRIVAGKIRNQRTILLRRQRRLRDPTLGDVLVFLRVTGKQAHTTDTIESLRGVEGVAARRYFEGVSISITNSAFSFNERNRRPPRDPFNACLSFGYALLFNKVDQAVKAAGLDASLGLLHESDRIKPALSLDLMEEFRPVVDALVLGLVNRGQVGPEDFRTPSREELGAEAEVEANAVYLGKVAKEILIRAFESRMHSQVTHPLRGERWCLKDLFLEQAHQITRIVEDPTVRYQPVKLED